MSDIRLLEIPKWGLSMEEGTIVEWLIAEGDDFDEGQEICEIESEKILNVLEAPFTGTLRKIIAEPGDILPVQAPIGVAAGADVPDSAIEDYVAELESGATAVSAQSGAQAADPDSVVPTEQHAADDEQTALIDAVPESLSAGSDDSVVHATPRARSLAETLGINLSNVHGTGRNRRISVADIKNAVAATGGQLPEPARPETSTRIGTTVSQFPVADEEFVDTPLSGTRRTIASRLQQSKQAAPHYRLTVDCRIDPLLKLREKIDAEHTETRLSVNDFFVKGASMALMQVPECNIQFDGATIRRFTDAHVAVAVALDSGLITPIIRSANTKSLEEIAVESSALITKAKEGVLSAEDIQGGTFTVSNLGMYGIKQFDAVINPPQAAIMSVGAGEERVIADNGSPVTAKIVTVTLTCDHRVIDGALGARFLESFRSHIENPAALVA